MVPLFFIIYIVSRYISTKYKKSKITKLFNWNNQ
jgi:hypothetical protein